MREYIITTEDTADLPESYVKEHGIETSSLSVILDGKTYKQGEGLDIKGFYQNLKAGAMPTTSQMNPQDCRAFFEKYLKQGLDIFHIGFSSGLSGTVNSLRIAAEELREEYPEATIIVVDSLCASLGEGLLVDYAVRKKETGCTIFELEEYIEGIKGNVAHLFTVDDLFHLHRGGRVSKAVAVVGSMMQIKPVLHVDDKGCLTALTSKVRGRKKALATLVDNMADRMKDYPGENDVIMISHSDCLQDAEYVQKLIEERFGSKTWLINYIGTTIGSHTGVGTVALFFMGNYR